METNSASGMPFCTTRSIRVMKPSQCGGGNMIFLLNTQLIPVPKTLIS
jgi:hypothetical protein